MHNQPHFIEEQFLFINQKYLSIRSTLTLTTNKNQTQHHIISITHLLRKAPNHVQLKKSSIEQVPTIKLKTCMNLITDK
jgi:hypothetical protein